MCTAGSASGDVAVTTTTTTTVSSGLRTGQYPGHSTSEHQPRGADGHLSDAQNAAAATLPGNRPLRGLDHKHQARDPSPLAQVDYPCPSSAQAPNPSRVGAASRLGGADRMRRPEGGLDVAAGSGTIEREEDASSRTARSPCPAPRPRPSCERSMRPGDQS